MLRTQTVRKMFKVLWEYLRNKPASCKNGCMKLSLKWGMQCNSVGERIEPFVRKRITKKVLKLLNRFRTKLIRSMQIDLMHPEVFPQTKETFEKIRSSQAIYKDHLASRAPLPEVPDALRCPGIVPPNSRTLT